MELDDLLAVMAARRGHFLLESGHHGELWLDVDRAFVAPGRLRPLVGQLADRLAPHEIESVCGPLTGGAFLAQMLAEEMGVAFVFANRIEARGPNEMFPVEYPISPELFEFVRGRRVAVANDVINAGSSVRGALASLRACGARPVAIGALLTLGSSPAELALDAAIPLESLAQLPSRIWQPRECPLCLQGVPLVE